MNLRVSDDYQTVLEWLRTERKTARDELEQRTDPVALAQSQGKATFIRDFLTFNETAGAKLKGR